VLIGLNHRCFPPENYRNPLSERRKLPP
jgi:hypothetical protein